MLYQGVTMGLQNKMQQNLNHLQLSAVKESEVAQSWLFSTPWSPPGSSIHGIFQAKILEWVAISFSLISALCSLEAKIRMVTEVTRGFPGGAAAKNPPAKARDSRDAGSIPGSGNPSGEGNGNPLQYSCLENSMARSLVRATVHGVAESWTQLSD